MGLCQIGAARTMYSVQFVSLDMCEVYLTPDILYHPSSVGAAFPNQVELPVSHVADDRGRLACHKNDDRVAGLASSGFYGCRWRN